MLRVSGLCHRYPGRPALALPDFTLEAGARCALIGPSGSGKTTLLHVLAGILSPSEGTVSLGGESIHGPRHDARWRARSIGLIPQRLHLLAALSVLDNVRLAQWACGLPDDALAAAELLQQIGLAAGLHRLRPGQLSQGQQQRVAIARALAHRPALLLADEPTAALDDANAALALDLLIVAAQERSALLLVATHDQRVRARFARTIELQALPASR